MPPPQCAPPPPGPTSAAAAQKETDKRQQAEVNMVCDAKISIYVSLSTYMNMYMYLFICTCIYVYICTYIHLYVYISVYISAHICINNAYTYMCLFGTRVNLSLSPLSLHTRCFAAVWPRPSRPRSHMASTRARPHGQQY